MAVVLKERICELPVQGYLNNTPPVQACRWSCSPQRLGPSTGARQSDRHSTATVTHLWWRGRCVRILHASTGPEDPAYLLYSTRVGQICLAGSSEWSAGWRPALRSPLQISTRCAFLMCQLHQTTTPPSESLLNHGSLSPQPRPSSWSAAHGARVCGTHLFGLRTFQHTTTQVALRA